MVRLIRVLRVCVYLAAALFLLQCLLILTGVPRSLQDWLMARDMELGATPRYVVVLGGGGIPSASGLMRTWYAADQGKHWPSATFVVALPARDNPADSHVGKMKDELVLRGIEADRIRMEHRGRNTYEQAVGTRALLGEGALQEPLLIVSSPTHLRRAILSFRKAGFEKVGVLPALDESVDADLGGGQWLRYGIWMRWGGLPIILRELTALGYYRCRGWI